MQLKQRVDGTRWVMRLITALKPQPDLVNCAWRTHVRFLIKLWSLPIEMHLVSAAQECFEIHIMSDTDFAEIGSMSVKFSRIATPPPWELHSYRSRQSLGIQACLAEALLTRNASGAQSKRIPLYLVVGTTLGAAVAFLRSNATDTRVRASGM